MMRKGLEILAKELEKVDGAKENAQVNIDLALYLDLLKNPANLKTLAESLPLMMVIRIKLSINLL